MKFSYTQLLSVVLGADPDVQVNINPSLIFPVCRQKRKTATVSVEVKKSQHRYVIGPRGAGLTEILAATGVSVEIPPSDNVSETISLRGDPDKLGPALTMVYAKVVTHEVY